MMEQAQDVDIVTFASPSAARFWANKVGTKHSIPVVIGPTTKDAAEALGFNNVVMADPKFGLEGFANTIARVAQSHIPVFLPP